MPAQPLNCFFLFCKEHRSSLALSNPELTNAEVTSLLAKNWKSLDSSVKTHYKAKAKKLNDEYKLNNPNAIRKTKNANFKKLTFSFKVESLSTPIKKPTVNHKMNQNQKPMKFINTTPNTEYIPKQRVEKVNHTPIPVQRYSSLCYTQQPQQYYPQTYDPLSIPPFDFYPNTYDLLPEYSQYPPNTNYYEHM